MKVSYGGRVRIFNAFPKDMQDFRQQVQAKFIKCKLIGPADAAEESKKMGDALSKGADSSQLKDIMDSGIAERELWQKEGKKGSQKGNTNTINFEDQIIFYEDSEGDLNVISEDEDLVDATKYVA